VGIEGFGANLKRLVEDPRRDCSAACLAEALGFRDPSTVYRWMRGEKTPSLNSDYAAHISTHLKLTHTEAQDLRNAQIRSLSDRKPRLPRRKPAGGSGSVEPLLEHSGQARHEREAVRERMAPPNASAMSVTLQMIELLEGLPTAAGRTGEDKTIVLTWQSRDPIDLTPDLQERWQAAIQTALRRGWRILYLCRLDANTARTVRLVEMMRDFFGAGAYTPRYFRTYGTLSPAWDMLIIPGIAAVMIFATRTAYSGDASIVTWDAQHIHTLLAYAKQLVEQTTPFVNVYFLSKNAIAMSQVLIDAESHEGGRLTVKDELSVITQPEAWFDGPRPPGLPETLPSEDWRTIAERRKARIAAFKRNIDVDDYYDICTERAIKRLQRSAYPDASGWRQARLARERRERCLEHLRNTVALLRQHERYHLALVSDHQLNDPGPNGIPIDPMWEVTGDNNLFLSAQIPDESGNPAPANLHISEPTIAEGFRESFRHMWERIPPVNREKEAVIRWIERQIRDLERELVRPPS
jgi:hypothetical protein